MTAHRPGTEASDGDRIADRQLTTIHGTEITVPDPSRLVHLQLRRFAGCPVCNLHLRTFVGRDDELTSAGVREVVVFHSTADGLREHAGDLPFDVIADPGKALYAEFGVESKWRALLDPRAWPAIVRAVAVVGFDVVRRRRAMPPLRPDGGRYGLPVDLLIGPDGRVIAAHYGQHADDHWSVDDVLDLCETERLVARTAR